MRVPDDTFITEAELRPEIGQSWRRSLLSGLRPDTTLRLEPQIDIDLRGRLRVAAGPVLDQITQELDGTGYGILLADSGARIVARRFGEARLGSAFDRAGVVIGSRFQEETTGTNSIATVFELRRGFAVLGEEHYVESLKRFSCYGHPLFSRITGRLEGVLDITCPAELANPLLAPFLRRAAREIEQRLLQGAREAEQRLLAAYQSASAGGRRAVAALADGVVMASTAAMELLDPSDHAVLRSLAADLSAGSRPVHRNLELTSGRRVAVTLEPVIGTGGVLVTVDDRTEPRPMVPRSRERTVSPVSVRAAEFERLRLARRPVLISGEPGTGRTATADLLAEGLSVCRLDAVELSGTGAAELALRISAANAETVVVEDVHLLPPPLVAQVARLLRDQDAWTVLTSAPVAGLAPEHAALAARCLARIELPPLRARREELPSLIGMFTERLRPEARLRFTPQALEALAAHPWPGNLHELREVLLHVLHRRSAGDVTRNDLPPVLREAARVRGLSLVERAEYETIVAALRSCYGNKVHAARMLGIGRATLYRRIRALGIDDGVSAPPVSPNAPLSQIATVTGG